MKKNKPLVAVIMGSDSDLPVMKDAGLVLEELKIPHTLSIISAHRTPQEMMKFAKNAHKKGIRVIIAGAGGAAHLPGMVAANSILPVIGVPVPIGHLEGQDSLLSIVQMPRGVPVATVAIGNAYNAGILAAQILASGGKTPQVDLQKRLSQLKEKMRKMVLAKKIKSQSK